MVCLCGRVSLISKQGGSVSVMMLSEVMTQKGESCYVTSKSSSSSGVICKHFWTFSDLKPFSSYTAQRKSAYVFSSFTQYLFHCKTNVQHYLFLNGTWINKPSNFYFRLTVFESGSYKEGLVPSGLDNFNFQILIDEINSEKRRTLLMWVFRAWLVQFWTLISKSRFGHAHAC